MKIAVVDHENNVLIAYDSADIARQFVSAGLAARLVPARRSGLFRRRNGRNVTAENALAHVIEDVLRDLTARSGQALTR